MAARTKKKVSRSANACMAASLPIWRTKSKCTSASSLAPPPLQQRNSAHSVPAPLQLEPAWERRRAETASSRRRRRHASSRWRTHFFERAAKQRHKRTLRTSDLDTRMQRSRNLIALALRALVHPKPPTSRSGLNGDTAQNLAEPPRSASETPRSASRPN